MHAPSAHNQQAREFFVIEKQKEKDFLAGILQYGKMLPQANKLIIGAFNTFKLKSPNFIQQDMGACTQNILLSAHEKGIGGVRVGVYPEEESAIKAIKEHFNLPAGIEVFNIIALGYPDTSKPLRDKKCLFPEKIHRL